MVIWLDMPGIFRKQSLASQSSYTLQLSGETAGSDQDQENEQMGKDNEKSENITSSKKTIIYLLLSASNISSFMCIALMAPIFPQEVSLFVEWAHKEGLHALQKLAIFRTSSGLHEKSAGNNILILYIFWKAYGIDFRKS